MRCESIVIIYGEPTLDCWKTGSNHRFPRNQQGGHLIACLIGEGLFGNRWTALQKAQELPSVVNTSLSVRLLPKDRGHAVTQKCGPAMGFGKKGHFLPRQGPPSTAASGDRRIQAGSAAPSHPPDAPSQDSCDGHERDREAESIPPVVSVL